jgi:hypothetical protein
MKAAIINLLKKIWKRSYERPKYQDKIGVYPEQTLTHTTEPETKGTFNQVFYDRQITTTTTNASSEG